MFDVEAEHAQCRLLTIEDIRRFLVAAGVPPSALNRGSDGVYWPIRRDRVVFHKPTRFEFERYMPGEAAVVNAYVLVLLDASGDPADILAFRPDGSAASWLGSVAMAGEEQVLAPRLDNALDAHDSVMAWLRAGRAGITILDHGRAASRLEGMTVRAASGEHAKRLRAALTLPAPRIIVAKSEAARAA